MTTISSIDDLIVNLSNKGLIIIDKDRVKRYLTHIGYFRLNKYFSFFYKNGYLQDTPFDKVLNLYIFDRKLRILILEAIERIEVSIRSNIVESLTSKFNDEYFYVKPAIFINHDRYHKFIVKVIESLKNLENTCVNSKYKFNHKENDYALPASWEFFHLLTFKQLSVFMSNLKNSNAKIISDRYNFRNTKVFLSWVHSLSDLRNICAHHAHLWNRIFGVTPMIPKLDNDLIPFIPDEIEHEVSFNIIKPHRKLYFQIVILWLFLKQISPKSSWIERLKSLIKEYNIPTIHMGFPPLWDKDKFWQKL